MVNVNEIERKLKAEDVGTEGCWVEVTGSPSVDFDQDGNRTGKIKVPVTMGGKRTYTFRANADSVDVIADKLGDETADWLKGEIFVGLKSAKFGKESVTWVVALDARTTKARDTRLEHLGADERNSRLLSG